MECNCKHNQEKIAEDMQTLDMFRKLFIRRMTVDDDPYQKGSYNEPVFYWDIDDEKEADPKKAYEIYENTSMDMVLWCFDHAVMDYEKAIRDGENADTEAK